MNNNTPFIVKRYKTKHTSRLELFDNDEGAIAHVYDNLDEPAETQRAAKLLAEAPLRIAQLAELLADVRAYRQAYKVVTRDGFDAERRLDETIAKIEATGK